MGDTASKFNLPTNSARLQKDKRYQTRKIEEIFSSPEEPGWESWCLSCGTFSCNGRKFPEQVLPKNEEFKNIWICSDFTKIKD